MLVRPLHSWPELRAPFMVVALRGWVDAGSSAQLAAAALREGWALDRIAVFDGDEFLDYQHRRPGIRLDEDGRRRVEWQEIELLAGSAGPRDMILLTGPEPARAWPSFVDGLVATVRQLGVQEVCGLGGLPAPAPHTRPVGVAATASTAALTADFDILLGSYEGPTGLQTVLQVACQAASIPMVSMWAQVPHYLAAMAWPGGAIALLRQLGDRTGTQPSLEGLLAADRERRRQIDEAIQERPDIQGLVSALEEGETVEDLPSGDDLAAEIERFLAGPDADPPPA